MSTYDSFCKWHWLLPIVSGLLLLGCANYCFFIWTPRPVRSFIVADIGIICGIYCGTLSKFAAALTLITGAGLIAGGVFLRLGFIRTSIWLSVIFGIVSIPVGIPAIFSAFFTFSQKWKVEG